MPDVCIKMNQAKEISLGTMADEVEEYEACPV